MRPRRQLALAVVAWTFAAQALWATNDAVTWSSGVGVVVHERCATCHHDGGPAPMTLLTWEQTRPWARSIAREVESRAMPPWHADPAHGEFANERRLPDAERDLLLQWIEIGAPQGDATAAPEPPTFASGWTIGEPDLTITMDEEVVVAPEGDLPYHDYIVDPGFTEDVWVKAAQARPGNPAVVHHIIVGFLIEDPLARRRLAKQGLGSRTQGNLGGYVPGDEPLILADGLARRIPAGSKIYFQMHYTPTGQTETDRSSLGLVLADGPPEHIVHTGIASSPFIHIPAGSKTTSLSADVTFERDAVLLSMRPHMHLRGKEFEYRATFPDGTEETLLRVTDYDFGWQTRYVLAEPRKLPAGTKLTVTGTWDNSADNPNNPDPTTTVSWGQQTENEMMIGFFAYYETGDE